MKIPAVLSRIWAALRAPTPKPATVTAVAPSEKTGWGPRLLELLGHAEQDPATARKYELPNILDGVRPAKPSAATDVVLAFDGAYREAMAMDDMAAPAAWGVGTAFGPGLSFLGFPYLAELAQVSEYRIPAEALSTEMTRRWGEVVNTDDTDKSDACQQMEEALVQFKVRDHVRETVLKTEQFGRGHIMPNIKGQDNDRARQLPLLEIPKGSLLGFSCVEAYWLTPYSWNSTEPQRPDFYRPQSWFVLGKKTHHTRIMTMILREVPDLLKPAYDFAGVSMTQLMMPYVQRWFRTAKNVNDLINIFSVVTLSTDMAALLSAPVDSPESLISRLRGFTQMRDNRGMLAIDKATEELNCNEVSLASLDKLQAQAQEHLATPARMPLSKFFGTTPAGLNATSEFEMQIWYDYVHSMQELGATVHMKRILDLIQMHLFGKVNPKIQWKWLPLDEPTGKELAEQRKAKADEATAYVAMGAVAPEEVRGNLQDDPESGWDNLVGEAPEPPAEQEHALGEKSADNDANRSEEAATANHARAKEMLAAKPAPGSSPGNKGK